MRLLFFVFLWSWSSVSYSQEMTISNPNTNFVYVGFFNPLYVVVDGLECGEFYFTTDNGDIEGDSCKFVIRADTVGSATIVLNRIVGGDTLLAFAQQDIRVREWPDPMATVGRSTGGEIRKSTLQVQPGIIVDLVNIGPCMNLEVDSFSVLIVRDEKVIFKDSQTGNRFSEDLVKTLQTIEIGDEVIFHNLRVKMPAGPDQSLTPLFFKVI